MENTNFTQRINTIPLANEGFILIRALISGRFNTQKTTLISRFLPNKITQNIDDSNKYELAYLLADALHNLPDYESSRSLKSTKQSEDLTINKIIKLADKSDIFKSLLNHIDKPNNYHKWGKYSGGIVIPQLKFRTDFVSPDYGNSE